MGWTGCFLDQCPKGQERIMEAIKQEGYNFMGDCSSCVIGSAIVGSTVYLAVKYDGKSQHIVYGAVILTAYDKDRREFQTKAMSEDMNPYGYDCPKRILDLLTPATSEGAKEWRRLCAERRAQKKPDNLAKCEFGTIVIRKDTGERLECYKYRNRKVFVNWFSNMYLTPAHLRKVGYEIVKESEE